jgi:hypothetical protein
MHQGCLYLLQLKLFGWDVGRSGWDSPFEPEQDNACVGSVHFLSCFFFCACTGRKKLLSMVRASWSMWRQIQCHAILWLGSSWNWLLCLFLCLCAYYDKVLANKKEKRKNNGHIYTWTSFNLHKINYILLCKPYNLLWKIKIFILEFDCATLIRCISTAEHRRV